jgi:hypothetical protein
MVLCARSFDMPYAQSKEAEMLSTRLLRPKVGAIRYEESAYYM